MALLRCCYAFFQTGIIPCYQLLVRTHFSIGESGRAWNTPDGLASAICLVFDSAGQTGGFRRKGWVASEP